MLIVVDGFLHNNTFRPNLRLDINFTSRVQGNDSRNSLISLIKCYLIIRLLECSVSVLDSSLKTAISILKSVYTCLPLTIPDV